MKFHKSVSQKIAMAVAFLALSAVMAEPTYAADLFDRISVINSKLPVLKVAMIYVAFLLGIGALIWSGIEMMKISKPDQRGEATWSGILVKGVAGAILVGLTFFSDTMQSTLFGSSTQAPSNTSMIAPETHSSKQA